MVVLVSIEKKKICLNTCNFYPHPGIQDLGLWSDPSTRQGYLSLRFLQCTISQIYLTSENSPTIMYYPRNTPKIVTFPATLSNTMPFVGSSASPTTNQTPVYGRTRTVYVTSDVDISEWDTHSINAIYALANGPESENEQEDLAKQPIHSGHSSIYSQAAISESAVDHSEESRVVSPPGVNASSAPEQLIAMAPATTSTQSSKLCDVSGPFPFPCPWIVD